MHGSLWWESPVCVRIQSCRTHSSHNASHRQPQPTPNPSTQPHPPHDTVCPPCRTTARLRDPRHTHTEFWAESYKTPRFFKRLSERPLSLELRVIDAVTWSQLSAPTTLHDDKKTSGPEGVMPRCLSFSTGTN